MRSGPQSIAAGAFAVGENSPSAQTKGLGTRARVRIFACVTTILGPVRRGIYEAEKLQSIRVLGARADISMRMCGFYLDPRMRSRSEAAAPHRTLHSPLFYHTEPAPQQRIPPFIFGRRVGERIAPDQNQRNPRAPALGPPTKGGPLHLLN